MSLENTRHTPAEIAALLTGVKNLWFIGIGGVHMSALALLSRARGFRVAGSDRAENEHTARLRKAGVTVFSGHGAAQMIGAEAVVYTLAISEDNPEYRMAKGLALPLFSRADFLGFIAAGFERRIGIAGTHGKSTVTAMLGETLWRVGRLPNVVCGATVRAFEAPFFAGGGKEFVFEACEYKASFLSLDPTLAVILNTELDHVDFFQSEQALKNAFAAFAEKAKTVLLPAEDATLLAAAKANGQNAVTFGLQAGDYRATALARGKSGYAFDLVTPTGTVGRISLSVPGLHNVKNALAAAAAALLCGVSPAELLPALSAFRGVARRMEYKGILCGAAVYDDYAHHPTEIEASLTAARALLGGGRLFVVFQSHTYTRTAAFFDDIARALRTADRVIVADIYAARERAHLGITASGLAAAIGGHASYAGGLRDITATLKRELAPGDLLLVMGAGDIDRIFTLFWSKDFTL